MRHMLKEWKDKHGEAIQEAEMHKLRTATSLHDIHETERENIRLCNQVTAVEDELRTNLRLAEHLEAKNKELEERAEKSNFEWKSEIETLTKKLKTAERRTEEYRKKALPPSVGASYTSEPANVKPLQRELDALRHEQQEWFSREKILNEAVKDAREKLLIFEHDTEHLGRESAYWHKLRTATSLHDIHETERENIRLCNQVTTVEDELRTNLRLAEHLEAKNKELEERAEKSNFEWKSNFE